MANFDDIFTAPAEQKKEQNEQKKPRRNNRGRMTPMNGRRRKKQNALPLMSWRIRPRVRSSQTETVLPNILTCNPVLTDIPLPTFCLCWRTTLTPHSFVLKQVRQKKVHLFSKTKRQFPSLNRVINSTVTMIQEAPTTT